MKFTAIRCASSRVSTLARRAVASLSGAKDRARLVRHIGADRGGEQRREPEARRLDQVDDQVGIVAQRHTRQLDLDPVVAHGANDRFGNPVVAEMTIMY